MNILLINHYAGSTKHGMEYRPYYLAREWTRNGHTVTVVAASYSHVRTSQPVITGTGNEEIIDGIRYLWLKTPGYRGNGAARAINMLVFVWRLWLLKSYFQTVFRPDVVIASSTYPLDAFPARRITKRTGARLVFEVHDLWPLSPMELGSMSKWHPFIMIMQVAENYAYRHANAVVSMLPAAKEHMIDHGMAPGKFVVIPNGIDVEEWNAGNAPLPAEHAGLLNRLRKEERFIVCYAGAHGVANALDSLIDAASRLVDQPVTFVLVGQGQEKQALGSKVDRLALRNVEFLPPVPKASVPALLSAADALYIGLQDQPLFRYGVSPNKLMDYMMSSKPVISAIRAGNDIVRESGCGVSIPPEQPEELVNAVKALMQMTPGERETVGRNGRTFALKNHDYRVLASRFEATLSGNGASGHELGKETN